MIGMLEEHEPRGSSSAGTAQIPDDEKKLGDQIDKIFEKAISSRKRYDRCWLDHYNFYRGKQWLKKRPSYRHAEVINMVFSAIQQTVPMMTDARPKVGFTPKDPSDLQFSEILNQVFESDWHRHNWLYKTTEMIYNAHFYGTAISGLDYESNFDYGAGGICFRALSTFDAYPDPDAMDINDPDGDFYIEARPVTVDKLKKKYAGHKYAKYLKSDLESMHEKKYRTDLIQIKKQTDLDINPDKMGYGNSLDEEWKDKALVVTVWLKPNDTEEVLDEKETEKTGTEVWLTRKKYPYGRKIVKIGQYIFEDVDFEYDHGEIPRQRLINYIDPQEFWGISDIEQLKSPQMTFNKVVSFALDVMTLMGNPVWLVPLQSGVNTAKLINQPGLIIEHEANFAPVRQEGVQLQPYVLQMIDRLETWFNGIQGNQEVSQGINPPGVTANAAIETLLQQATGRVRQKLRNLGAWFQQVGRQYVGLVMQYYTAPQIFRITNNDKSSEYFKMHVEDRPVTDELGQPKLNAAGKPETQKIAVYRKYEKNDFGVMVPSLKADEYQIRGDFDVEVDTISGLPFAQAEKENRLLQYYDRQIIDAEELLKQVDYPNYESIIERMKQQQAAAAQAPAPAA
jgi:hypothetical protein